MRLREEGVDLARGGGGDAAQLRVDRRLVRVGVHLHLGHLGDDVLRRRGGRDRGFIRAEGRVVASDVLVLHGAPTRCGREDESLGWLWTSQCRVLYLARTAPPPRPGRGVSSRMLGLLTRTFASPPAIRSAATPPRPLGATSSADVATTTCKANGKSLTRPFSMTSAPSWTKSREGARHTSHRTPGRHVRARRSRRPIRAYRARKSAPVRSRASRAVVRAATTTSAQGIVVVTDPSQEEIAKCKSWGTWGCEASKFPWTYGSAETCYLLAGEVTVTPDGGEPVSFKAGDIVTFPAGMSCTWDVKVAVKKHFNFH